MSTSSARRTQPRAGSRSLTTPGVRSSRLTTQRLFRSTSSGIPYAALSKRSESFLLAQVVPHQVKINTHDFFSVGSVFVLDAVHIPFGCSVCVSYLCFHERSFSEFPYFPTPRYGRVSGRRDLTGQLEARSTSWSSSTSRRTTK